jgi:hypothetical protein
MHISGNRLERLWRVLRVPGAKDEWLGAIGWPLRFVVELLSVPNCFVEELRDPHWMG